MINFVYYIAVAAIWWKQKIFIYLFIIMFMFIKHCSSNQLFILYQFIKRNERYCKHFAVCSSAKCPSVKHTKWLTGRERFWLAGFQMVNQHKPLPWYQALYPWLFPSKWLTFKTHLHIGGNRCTCASSDYKDCMWCFTDSPLTLGLDVPWTGVMTFSDVFEPAERHQNTHHCTNQTGLRTHFTHDFTHRHQTMTRQTETKEKLRDTKFRPKTHLDSALIFCVCVCVLLMQCWTGYLYKRALSQSRTRRVGTPGARSRRWGWIPAGRSRGVCIRRTAGRGPERLHGPASSVAYRSELH